ncbi:MAG: hypothetical protein QOJ26_565, partial [Thermoplasmata archaeon]|nr:hypothetical protein [Thermoplasmata archaeon]
FLAINIVAILLGGGGNANSRGAAGTAVDFIGFLALVAYLVLAALTQSHLNRVWQGRPAP